MKKAKKDVKDLMTFGLGAGVGASVASSMGSNEGAAAVGKLSSAAPKIGTIAAGGLLMRSVQMLDPYRKKGKKY